MVFHPPHAMISGMLAPLSASRVAPALRTAIRSRLSRPARQAAVLSPTRGLQAKGFAWPAVVAGIHGGIRSRHEPRASDRHRREPHQAGDGRGSGCALFRFHSVRRVGRHDTAEPPRNPRTLSRRARRQAISQTRGPARRQIDRQAEAICATQYAEDLAGSRDVRARRGAD